MTHSSPYKDLFANPTTIDKLNLFQNLFDASEMDVDLALALLKVIHRELGDEQVRDRSAYKRYAKIIETLRYHKLDMLRQVVNAWKAGKIAKDPEWLSDGLIK